MSFCRYCRVPIQKLQLSYPFFRDTKTFSCSHPRSARNPRQKAFDVKFFEDFNFSAWCVALKSFMLETVTWLGHFGLVEVAFKIDKICSGVCIKFRENRSERPIQAARPTGLVVR
jgi:hypothetical protein